MYYYDTVISSKYDTPIRKSLAVQAIVALLAALTLDGGVTARVVGAAILAYWLCTALVIARRPHGPTSVDLAIIHWGFWPVLGVAMLRQAFA